MLLRGGTAALCAISLLTAGSWAWGVVKVPSVKAPTAADVACENCPVVVKNPFVALPLYFQVNHRDKVVYSDNEWQGATLPGNTIPVSATSPAPGMRVVYVESSLTPQVNIGQEGIAGREVECVTEPQWVDIGKQYQFNFCVAEMK